MKVMPICATVTVIIIVPFILDENPAAAQNTVECRVGYRKMRLLEMLAVERL